MRKQNRILASQAGSSLLIALAVVVVIGILAAMISNVSQQFAKAKSISNLHRSAFLISQNITTVLKNKDAWTLSLQKDANKQVFDCLIKKEDCTGKGGNFVLVDSADAIYIAAPSNETGFDYSGRPCVRGQGPCPILVTVRWAPVCASSCVNPLKKIKLSLALNPDVPIEVVFNPSIYEAEVYL